MKTFIKLSRSLKFIYMDCRKRDGVRKAKTLYWLTVNPHRFNNGM